MPKIETHPLIWARDDSQSARHIDPEEDRQLTESIKAHGILQPPGVLADGRLVYGRRRVRCAIAAGLKEALFYILDKPMFEDEVKLLELTENIQRQELTDPELYLSIKELVNKHPDWQRQHIAEKIQKSASMVTRILSVDDLIPQARDAFLAGDFGFAKAYTIAKAGSHLRQQEMLAAIRSGASRDEAEIKRRGGQNGTTSSVKMSRVNVLMPKGASVVLIGKDLGMAEVVDLLSETLKEARKAADQYDVKTWVSMMRDKCKSGGAR